MPPEEEGCITAECDRPDKSIPASWVEPDLDQRNLENRQCGPKQQSMGNTYQLEQQGQKERVLFGYLGEDGKRGISDESSCDAG